jgi:hypothetical protein
MFPQLVERRFTGSPVSMLTAARLGRMGNEYPFSPCGRE